MSFSIASVLFSFWFWHGVWHSWAICHRSFDHALGGLVVVITRVGGKI